MIKKISIGIVFIIFVFVNAISIKAKEEGTPEFSVGGDFSYITIDHKATTNIKWKNAGFNVTIKKTHGDPLSDPKCVTIFYDQKNATHNVVDNGHTKTTTYKINGEYLKKKINEKYGENYYDDEMKDGMKIYFNDIFQVTHYGKNYGKPKHSLEAIKKAEYWSANALSDFPIHFDMEIEFVKVKPKIQKARVVYKIYKNNKWIQIDGPKDLEKKKWGEVGKKTSHTLSKSKDYKGKEYYLYASYYTKADKNNGKRYNMMQVGKNIKLEQVQNQEGKILEGGTLFVGIMKEKNSEIIAREDEKMKEIELPYTSANIRSDFRNSEIFDVEEGIPTTENLYTQVLSNEYLCGYKFIKKSGTRKYPITINKTYNLKWTKKVKSTSDKINKEDNEKEKIEHHTDTVTCSKKVEVIRKYSYWVIDNLDVYGLDYAIVNNEALPSESIKLFPRNYILPNVNVRHTENEEAHIISPVYEKQVNLPLETINGGDSKPIAPNIEFEIEARNIANTRVPKITVKNDYLEFNGKTIIDDKENKEESVEPIDIEESKQIDENVFYKNGLTIDKNKTNGDKESNGEVIYKRIIGIKENDIPTNYGIEEINNVRIHTPIVCDALIEDKKADNQMLDPAIDASALVLDRPFYVKLPTTGNHLFIKNYEYRDYGKYIEKRQVKFPFDVYKGNKYITADTWVDFILEEEEYYLPIWVKEKKYTINFRSISINALANNKIDATEENANLSIDNYVARDSIDVEVSGRIYDFKMYDVSDYPIWRDVFRKPLSLVHTGFLYTTGNKNQNGQNNESLFTLPLINGSHPFYKNIGTLKTGYMSRFSFVTIGNMAGKDDKVKIDVSFYHVNKDGSDKKEVDLYYKEPMLNVSSGKLIKIGSELEKENKKDLYLGNPYMSVPKNEIENTAIVKNKSYNDISQRREKIRNYSKIELPTMMQTLIGNSHDKVLEFGIPNDMCKEEITIAKQKWYFEYMLPAKIYIVEKDYDVKKALKGKRANLKEPFFIKDGYIILHFDIKTLENHREHLSYENALNARGGYCNMWEREGFLKEKTDYKSNKFEFNEGDIALYYTDKSAKTDFRMGGTH